MFSEFLASVKYLIRLSSAHPWVTAVVCGIAWGLMQWMLLTDTVVAYNDDFGYLRSIVETFRRGRPWTDDWLEPWSASLSLISALVWKITGSFKLATHSVQATCVAVGYIGVSLLYIGRGLQGWGAALVAGFLFTVPTILWKNLEFTAFVLYVACFFLAIYSAERQRWLSFSVYMCVALASRQSALAWLAIPAIEWLHRVRAPGRAPVRSQAIPLAVLFIGGAFYVLCQLVMNRTHAQGVMTSAMWSSLQPRSILRWLIFSLFLIYAALGLGNLAITLLTGRAVTWKAMNQTTLFVRVIVPVIVIGTFVAVLGRFDLQYEHGLLSGPLGSSYMGICGFLAVVGWAVAPMIVDWKLLGGALACAAITSIRGAVWDYYFVDTALLAFFAARSPVLDPLTNSAAQSDYLPRNIRRSVRLAATVLLLAILGPIHATFIGISKRTLDNFQALTILGEKSLRSHKISVTDLSFAPFGYIGWHLYPYFVSHEGAGGAYIADFLGYLKQGSVILATRGADDPRPLEHPETVVEAEAFHIGWRERHLFILRRGDTESHAPAKINAVDYRYQPFPLNDAEWLDLVRDRSVGKN